MKIKQKMALIVTLLGLVSGISTALSTDVYAVDVEIECSDGSTVIIDSGSDPSDACPEGTTVVTPPADSAEEEPDCTPGDEGCCGGVKTSIIGGGLCGSAEEDGSENGPIFNLLLNTLRILTAGIGIAAVGGIAYGALLYTTAENKPEQTKKAIGIITNVVIGIVAYGLMFVLLNFLIPGGVITR